MYSEILSLLKTKQDLIRLREEIAELEKSLFKKDADLRSSIASTVRSDTALAFEKVLSKAEINKKDFLKGLRDELDKLGVIEIVVAFEPSESSITRIHEWINQKVSKDILVDIKVDKSLIGGAVVINKGKIGDYSARKKLEKYFLNNKKELKKYLFRF